MKNDLQQELVKLDSITRRLRPYILTRVKARRQRAMRSPDPPILSTHSLSARSLGQSVLDAWRKVGTFLWSSRRRIERS